MSAPHTRLHGRVGAYLLLLVCCARAVHGTNESSMNAATATAATTFEQQVVPVPDVNCTLGFGPGPHKFKVTDAWDSVTCDCACSGLVHAWWRLYAF